MRHLAPLVMLSACVGSISTPAPIDDVNPVGPIGGSGGGTTQPPPEMIPPFEPAPLQGRLLLSWQYVNAIRDVLGAQAAAVVVPPGDVAINGLSAIGAGTVSLSTSQVQQYETNAYAAAAKATLSYGCTATGAIDDACFGKFLDAYGKRLFRRPLTADERTTWTSVQHTAAMAYSSFSKGVEYALAGMLQSPAFLYRFETGTVDASDRMKLSGYELATRLSFFLAGTTPSDALLAAAENGELDTADGIRAHAATLLSEPAAGPALSSFFDELLELGELQHAGKDATLYPSFDAQLALSMRNELHHFVENEAFGSDFRGLLDADHTYVDAKLAALYQLPAPATAWSRVALRTDQPRAGLLGEGGFLALKAHPVNTSPTLRGKLVREKLLCEPVAAPPPDVNTNLPEAPMGQNLTLREKLAAHMTTASCAACHKLMDPIGFGFESFDAIGAYRTTDHGKPIDASGTLDTKAFSDARGLVTLLKDDKRVARCITRSLYRQAAGHVELYGETAPLREAEAAFVASGYQLRFLLVELAASDALRYGRTAP